MSSDWSKPYRRQAIKIANATGKNWLKIAGAMYRHDRNNQHEGGDFNLGRKITQIANSLGKKVDSKAETVGRKITQKADSVGNKITQKARNVRENMKEFTHNDMMDIIEYGITGNDPHVYVKPT